MRKTSRKFPLHTSVAPAPLPRASRVAASLTRLTWRRAAPRSARSGAEHVNAPSTLGGRTSRQNTRLLYLQLPCLDNDLVGARENVPLAALCLDQTLKNAGLQKRVESLFLPPDSDDAGNRRVVEMIADIQPDIIAASVYLWNIERTLRVLRAVRRRHPNVRVALGGPEVALHHPFLYRWHVWDVAVSGEGEAVFPDVVRFFTGGRAPDFANVAIREKQSRHWGRHSPPRVELAKVLPSASRQAAHEPRSSIAYLETTRGCPMRCSYCRYHHLRRDVDVLAPATVARNVEAFLHHGFREVRFIDPTLNSHPRFTEVIRRIARVNHSRRLCLFAELLAHTITDQQTDLLQEANFTEVEIGVQSIDPHVLRAVRRPASLHALADGIQRLTDRGIHVTLDIMYGLPLQTAADVHASIEWALRFPGANVQCLQTLLIPGSDLRGETARWGMAADMRPPYGVRATSALPEDGMRQIEAELIARPDLPSDTPTRQFVGRKLPDLFPAMHEVPAAELRPRLPIPGTANRRAIIFTGTELFRQANAIARFVRRAIRSDADALWQFVLQPEWEEPLDVLDAMIDAVRESPLNQLDRYGAAELTDRIASRRVFVQLQQGKSYDPAWIDGVEDALRNAFV